MNNLVKNYLIHIFKNYGIIYPEFEKIIYGNENAHKVEKNSRITFKKKSSMHWQKLESTIIITNINLLSS